MTKLLLLDKDGTIIRPKSGAKFVQSPEDQELITGVKEAIARYVGDGWSLAIASNQGGVATGYKTLDDAIAEMIFAAELIYCKEFYFCPSSVESDGDACVMSKRQDLSSGWLTAQIPKLKHGYRKPNPGMLLQAIGDRGGLDLSDPNSADSFLMVGDRPEDEGAAKAAGIPFMHVDKWLDRSPF